MDEVVEVILHGLMTDGAHHKFLTEHEKECHRRNATLLQDQKQGPIQECPS